MVDSISANIASTIKVSPPCCGQHHFSGLAGAATGKIATGDSVEISVLAQIKSMKDQGQTISEIALQMGLDTKTVASYLPGEDLA